MGMCFYHDFTQLFFGFVLPGFWNHPSLDSNPMWWATEQTGHTGKAIHMEVSCQWYFWAWYRPVAFVFAAMCKCRHMYPWEHISWFSKMKPWAHIPKWACVGKKPAYTGKECFDAGLCWSYAGLDLTSICWFFQQGNKVCVCFLLHLLLLCL